MCVGLSVVRNVVLCDVIMIVFGKVVSVVLIVCIDLRLR